MKAFWDNRVRRYGSIAIGLDSPFLNLAIIEVWERGWETLHETFQMALDAGTGVGRLLPELAKKSINVVGVDISPRMVRIAKMLYGNVNFCVMSLDHLGFRDQSFDFVNTAYVIMHIPNAKRQEMATKEIGRVVKNGGTLLMAEEILSREHTGGFALGQTTGFERSFWLPLRLDPLTLVMKKEGLHLQENIGGLPYVVFLLLHMLSVITHGFKSDRRLLWLSSKVSYFLTMILQRIFRNLPSEDSMFKALIFRKKIDNHQSNQISSG